MKDTGPKVAELFRQMMMARSGVERLRMGAEMFDTAVELVTASLDPALDENGRRAALFLRFYGRDLPRKTVEDFLERLARRTRTG